MQIVYGGNEAFDALLYRNNPHNQAHQAYLGARLESMSNSNPAMANTEFFQRAKQMYDRIYSSEAMTIARAAIAQVGHIFQEDNIRFLNTLVDIQNAPQTMQRWIMANPVVREKYHAQQCDGYSDTYQDVFPGLLREHHYDYRRVMNHVVEEDEQHGWSASHYVEDIFEGDRELELFEKAHILSTWEVIEGFMKAGDSDPTSIWNSKLWFNLTWYTRIYYAL